MMAQNSVAKAALILTTDSSAMFTNLDAAAGKLSSKLGSGGMFSKLGSGIGIGIAAGIAASLVTAGIGLVSAGIEKIVHGATERIPEIAKMGAFSKALNLTPEQFTSIAAVAKAAGSDTKEFVESLVTMGDRAKEALGGSGQGFELFSTLKLDAQQFVNLRMDQQFYAILTAIRSLPPGFQQVGAMLKSFGEDGGKLLIPLLAKSNDEIMRMGAASALTATQVAEASVASQSMTAAGAAISRAWDMVLIALTPVFDLVARMLPPAIDFLKPVFMGVANAVIPVIKFMTQAMARLVDVMKAAVSLITGPIGAVLEVLGRVGQEMDGGRSNSMLRTGQAIRKWSEDWGANSRAVDDMWQRFEDGRKQAVERTKNELKPVLNVDAPQAKPAAKTMQHFDNAALIQGSKEAFKAEVQFRMGGLDKADKQQIQIDLMKRGNEALNKIANNLVGGILRVI
jgi:hypothetical protein